MTMPFEPKNSTIVGIPTFNSKKAEDIAKGKIKDMSLLEEV